LALHFLAVAVDTKKQTKMIRDSRIDADQDPLAGTAIRRGIRAATEKTG